jgi:integrase
MLSDKAIAAAKPQAKPYKLADGQGLYLFITPAGSKSWRLKYRLAGKEYRLTFGLYPQVRAPQARALAAEAREKLAKGIDPAPKKHGESFQEVAEVWLAKVRPSLAESTYEKNETFLRANVFPWLGSKHVGEIRAPDILACVRRIDARGAGDVARRTHNLIGRVLRYGVSHGLCQRDASRDIELRDALAPRVTRHHSAQVDPKAVGELLRAIAGYKGSFIVRGALQLAPLLFIRPGELRAMAWGEIDFEKAELRIPASRMKMKEAHVVPLAPQALAILRELHPLTGSGRFVFPSERTAERPMSENTINAALRRLGYSAEEQTGHGFRTIASTLLHELGFPHAVIESQLAHAERNKVSAAYNRATHLPERRQMMAAWAEYLDGLRTGAKVIALRA